MRQAQFDQLLAWTMLNTLYGAELVMRSRIGRDLTQDELVECHKEARHAADAMRVMFAQN